MDRLQYETAPLHEYTYKKQEKKTKRVRSGKWNPLRLVGDNAFRSLSPWIPPLWESKEYYK